MNELVERLLAGEHRALARAITHIENRTPGYRELVSQLHRHTGNADIIGITGSPGSGKSTLVDKLAATYRDDGLTVGVIAIDPSSPFTGGAVLGDRIRMASNIGDMDVFFRSMSARGTLGGLSTATADAVKALDAFGKDRIIIETVGAGQNEIDIVKTADTVTVLVPPSSGDDIQMLKAGILEIGDVFVVNKADLSGADRTVQDLQEMLAYREGGIPGGMGHHGDAHHDTAHGGGTHSTQAAATGGDSDPAATVHPSETNRWSPRIVETVATQETGISELISAFDEHAAYLDQSGEREANARTRAKAEVRRLLREDVHTLVAAEIDRHGGVEQLAERIRTRETDPYAVADELIGPIEACIGENRTD